MSARREFTKAVKVEIIKRATKLCAVSGRGLRDMPVCEACLLPAKRFEIDHRDPDAMQIDKSAKLTEADGWLLCIPCHKAKTAKDKGDIARALRREAAHLGVKKKSAMPFSNREKKTEVKPSRHAGLPPLGPPEIGRRMQKGKQP